MQIFFDSENMFKITGYNNKKNAMSNRGFIRHDKSDKHKNCILAWVDYKKNKINNTSILLQLSNHHSIIVNENRKYMEAIIEGVKTKVV